MDIYLVIEGEDINRASKTDELGELYKDLPDDFMSKMNLYKCIDGVIKQVYTDDGEKIVPQEISKLQGIKYLLNIGRYHELMTAIDADSTKESRILFDASAVWDRKSSMVNSFALALNMSSNDIDSFFIEANKILI